MRTSTSLRDAFVKLKRERRLRNRDVAQALGVSEGEALAAFVGEHVVRLDARFPELFEEMPRLGRVMALTRNDAAVHEKDGAYAQMSHDGLVGLALGDIDLRIFYRQWAYAFAVRDD
ncbi:ChuX/HutX family heme-like substrate-binding protein, partial [Burkholderia multivorans]|uniref:ChuX/HutX family heme-like substrate-binding protein n=1 Tax=Burkholderia multivorans TaxID=87883 RepID=UPI0023EE535D